MTPKQIADHKLSMGARFPFDAPDIWWANGGGPDVPQAGEHSPAMVELAEQHEARLLARDEAFSGEVVAQIERQNESPAYVIEADGDRVMVPQVEGADMEVGDDVEFTRDQQGNYEAEADHGYGR